MNDDFLIHGICHWILKFGTLPAYACCCVLTVALLSDLKCVTIQRNSPDSDIMVCQSYDDSPFIWLFRTTQGRLNQPKIRREKSRVFLKFNVCNNIDGLYGHHKG